MPCSRSTPSPTADFTVPEKAVPASVTPMWSGYGTLSASRRYASIVVRTDDAFADNDVGESARLEVLAERHSARRELLGERPVEVVILGCEAAGVHADPDGDTCRARSVDDRVNARCVADVAGVDAKLGGAEACGLDGEPVVEVDVGDHRKRARFADARKPVERVCARDGHPDDLATRLGQFGDLTERRLGVSGVGVGHRLHSDGCVITKRDAADRDLRADASHETPYPASLPMSMNVR